MGSLRRNVTIKGHADRKRLLLAKRVLEKCKCKSVMDIGCGDGSFAYAFARMGLVVEAIDLNCKKARKVHNHPSIRYTDTDALDVASLGITIDAVHLGEVLEHVKCPEGMLAAAVACVPTDGVIIVSVPNFKHRNHLRTYSMKSITELCKKFFKVTEEKVISHSHKRDGSKRFMLYGHK